METGQPIERRRAPSSHKWTAPRERLAVQLIHWTIVLVVVLCVLVLALRGVLSESAVTAIYGTIVGHVGTSAQTKLSARSSD